MVGTEQFAAIKLYSMCPRHVLRAGGTPENRLLQLLFHIEKQQQNQWIKGCAKKQKVPTTKKVP